MKKFILLLLLCASAFFLPSCEVHWFNKSWQVEWYVIAIPVTIIFFIAHIVIINNTFKCPQCETEFKPRWYEISSWLHIGDKRVVKCPHCHRRGLCDKVD